MVHNLNRGFSVVYRMGSFWQKHECHQSSLPNSISVEAWASDLVPRQMEVLHSTVESIIGDDRSPIGSQTHDNTCKATYDALHRAVKGNKMHCVWDQIGISKHTRSVAAVDGCSMGKPPLLMLSIQLLEPWKVCELGKNAHITRNLRMT